MKHRISAALAAAALLAGGLTACAGGSDAPDGKKTVYQEGTLRVLASSELSDMQGILDRARQKTGVTVKFTWSGTLDAAEAVASGRADGAYDAIWLSSNDYLRLRPETAPKITAETPVMTSPVAFGVKRATADRLGWQDGRVTWSQIQQAVTRGELTYGMTDPIRSNSGFSALVSVASGLSGAQAALTDADVRKATPPLKEFFKGQKLTSGSSGWLAQAYARGGAVDGMINYESVLLSLKQDLTVIRPKDGVVTADYPLTLLTSAPAGARASMGNLVSYLRSPGAQQEITRQTLRRPVVPGVPLGPGLPSDKRRELPFPGTRSVADGLLSSYENELRRPSRTVYVLDTSGSMEDDNRIGRLRDALTKLTGTGDSPAGRRFRDREEVTLMPFGSAVKQVRTHVVDPTRPTDALSAIREDVDGLSPDGGTAIYSSLEKAYEHLGGDGRDAFTSIVLMTDGENGEGAKAGDFDAFYEKLPAAQRRTPVFPILFGDSDRSELDHIATLTGGRLFDATDGSGSLDGAFEEIRGYQ
ncbi:substrate-binding domain-containing protein [Streptomyces sp. NPDC093225]|uniref:substrate-binding domain-containing protein n=1 Tax=Streptomyces sp. NPDC093225 TaxID=3366034 RepID=UPI0037FB8AAF